VKASALLPVNSLEPKVLMLVLVLPQ